MGRPRPGDKLKDLVKEVVAPPLASMGFRYDGDRVFRRTVAREPFPSVQLVEFQAGQRWLSGRFTVNLGVYSGPRSPSPAEPVVDPLPSHCHPSMTTRLGLLRPGVWAVMRAVFGPDRMPLGDKWWPYGGDPQNVARTMNRVAKLVVRYGVPWLARTDEEEALRAGARPDP